MSTATKRTCRALNKRGEPCRATSITDDGLCAAHSGRVDMRAVGQAGGRASVRSRLGLDPEVADGRLRKLARRRLEELLNSDDEAKRLSAARALFSYSPGRAPSDEDEPPATDTVAALRVILRRLEQMSEGQLVELLDRELFNLLGRITKHDPELVRSLEQFTAALAALASRKQRAPQPDVRSPVCAETPVSVAPQSHATSQRVPSAAPPVPPPARSGRAVAEQAVSEHFRSEAEWQLIEQDGRKPGPDEGWRVDERARRLAAEAEEDDAA